MKRQERGKVEATVEIWRGLIKARIMGGRCGESGVGGGRKGHGEEKVATQREGDIKRCVCVLGVVGLEGSGE